MDLIFSIGAAILFLLIIITCTGLIYLIPSRKSQRPGKNSPLRGIRFVQTKKYSALFPDGSGGLVRPPSLIEIVPMSTATELNQSIIDTPVYLENTMSAGHFGEMARGRLCLTESDNNPQILAKYVTGISEKLITNDGIPVVEKFLNDVLAMRTFDHPNIHSILGVVLEESISALAIYPYLQYGDLSTFINQNRHKLTDGDRLHCIEQVANGLIYLADQNFVHNDLAARNCMLDTNYSVKIGDAALSSDIHSCDYEVAENWAVQIPARWMAPESLTAAEFTLRSNVWTFGVLMYEIFKTDSSKLYPDLKTADELQRYLQSPTRRLKRQYISVPDSLWKAMLKCWEQEADSRPDISQLAKLHKQIASLRDNNMRRLTIYRKTAETEVGGEIQTDTKNNINLVCADALLLALEDVAQLRPVIPDGDLSDLNTQ